jgi:23S rRNA (adenine2503-C2)-methyltransferase
VLYGSHIVNTCRYTKGDDISAACGQLALQEREGQAGGLPMLQETNCSV